MADCELVKEIMVALGEELEDLGYDGVLETVEGHGKIGKACKNCRYDADARLLAFYMKDVAKTFLQEQPSFERDKAKEALERAWQGLKRALHEDTEPDEDGPRTRVQIPQQQRRQLPARR